MYSQTYGKVSNDMVPKLIRKYIDEDKNANYKVMIGTDSQNRNLTKVVIVVAVHRVGKGGIFFYDIKNVPKITNLRQKIYYETALSLELGSVLAHGLAEDDVQQNIEIHSDIGRNGLTSELINEIVGWIKGAGFVCKIKPESYTASSIADRLSK